MKRAEQARAGCSWSAHVQADWVGPVQRSAAQLGAQLAVFSLSATVSGLDLLEPDGDSFNGAVLPARAAVLSVLADGGVAPPRQSRLVADAVQQSVGAGQARGESLQRTVPAARAHVGA